MMKSYSQIGTLALVGAAASLIMACSDDPAASSGTVISSGTSTGGNTTGAPGVGGGTAAATGGGTGTPAETAGSIEKTGSWVDGAGNTVGIQGSFFVLEDSMADGALVVDGMTHSDLMPDTFADLAETAHPCVNGTIAAVTASDGTECGFGAGDAECDWDVWGGGIGMNLNESGGEASVKGVWNATEHGVTGFTFTVTGDYGGTVRFKATQAGVEADFCTSIAVGAEPTTVLLTDLQHECWDPKGTLALDVTQLEALQWQLVSKNGVAYPVTNFCVESLAFTK